MVATASQFISPKNNVKSFSEKGDGHRNNMKELSN